jgi:hypothetical protein
MEVTTFEVVTASGISTLAAEDDYSSKTREANRNKNLYKDAFGKAECIICGKFTNAATSKFILLSIKGYFLSADSNEPQEFEGGEAQGFFEIGSECAKKFPKQFITADA